MSLIDDMKWRYATKKFDPTKRVSEQDLEQLKEAVRLAASSYGLQLFKVLVVEDKALREKLRGASWGQGQVTDASHLFVFCNYSEVQHEHIDAYADLKTELQNLESGSLKGYTDFIKNKLGAVDAQSINTWTAKQTYLALANLMSACAELRIDSCPMEGFEPAQVEELLGLKEKGLSAAVMCPVGYRAEDDQAQFATKVRKPMEAMFEVV